MNQKYHIELTTTDGHVQLFEFDGKIPPNQPSMPQYMLQNNISFEGTIYQFVDFIYEKNTGILLRYKQLEPSKPVIPLTRISNHFVTASLGATK